MSNRLTFSLASLILIMALGLVFGTTSVIAHNSTTINPMAEGNKIITSHGHPVNQDIANDPSTDDVIEYAPAHNAHPKVTSIALKSGATVRGSMVAVTSAANTFTLVVTFDQPVVSTHNVRTVLTDKLEGADAVVLDGDTTATAVHAPNGGTLGEFKVSVVNGDSTTADADTEIAMSSTVPKSTSSAADRTGTKGDTFEILVTFTDGSDDNSTAAFPSGKTGAASRIFKVKVNENAAYSLATTPNNIIGVVPGSGSEASSVYSFTLVNALGPAPTPTTGIEGKITGTASLTGAFPITITFAKSGVMLTEADIKVTGGGMLVKNSLYPSTPVGATNTTVYTATVLPYPNAAQVFDHLTVTLNTNARVKPASATMGGVLTIIRADGDLTSITAPAAANDQALFVATLTFANSLADDVSVMKTDLKVSAGAKIGDISPKLGTQRKVWEVEITPVKGKDTKIELSDAGKVKFGASTASATVMKKTAAPTIPTVITAVDATYDATKGETTLKGMLAAGGFAVVVAEDLPDIQRFYAEGGSISVLSSKTGAAAKDVVISEIMWGLNLRAIGNARSSHQFIELFNTTGATIDLKDVKLTFDGANTPPAAPTGMTLLDQLSNVEGIGWVITAAPGQSGRIALPDDVTTFVPSDLISMYRKINYVNVAKTHNATDAAKNREEQLKAVPGGNAIGSWAASNAADTYGVNLIGSPGMQHFVAYTVLTPTNVPRGTFVINEIGNHSNDAYDWVEIKRVGGGDNLKKWRLSQVTSDKKDTALVTFPDNDHHKIAAVGDVLLIVNSDPYQDPNHPLAAGTNITHNNGRAETTGVTSRYYVNSGLKLANSGKTLLILRNSNDNNHLGKPNNIQDVIGTLSIVDNAAGLRTKLWPLVAKNAPHGDVITDGPPEELKAGSVYVRNDAAANNAQNPDGGSWEHDLSTVGYTGVGYKRSAAKGNQHGGTPGYDNATVKVNDSELTDSAMISISEIMYAKNRNEPQWIELYNSSMTQAINLNEWKLKIEQSRDADDIDIRSTVTTNNLGGGIIIQPNQTVLIVSNTTGRTSRASQGGIDFPATRIINLWAQKDKLEVAAGVTRLTYRLLSETAFRVTLMDKSGATVDVAGNLGAATAWELPMSENGEGRSSIIRRYTDGEPDAGTMKASWTFARDSQLTWVRFNETYYGSPDDIGTPGFRAGGPLPVSLSKFRPERLDNGSIQIVWVTESELNNAGFNILRSEKRDSEFKQINTKLIAGQGTTSERTTYTHVDTSAKPNVVYYYQIQDVSLDGKVQTLRLSRLKGHVSPAGKITTTWGDIKALQ